MRGTKLYNSCSIGTADNCISGPCPSRLQNGFLVRVKANKIQSFSAENREIFFKAGPTRIIRNFNLFSIPRIKEPPLFPVVLPLMRMNNHEHSRSPSLLANVDLAKFYSLPIKLIQVSLYPLPSTKISTAFSMQLVVASSSSPARLPSISNYMSCSLLIVFKNMSSKSQFSSIFNQNNDVWKVLR